MAETNGANSSDRLVEALANTHIDVQQDFKSLYRSQVVMREVLTKLAESHKELLEVQQQADARMGALIVTVDEIIRGRKREG